MKKPNLNEILELAEQVTEWIYELDFTSQEYPLGEIDDTKKFECGSSSYIGVTSGIEIYFLERITREITFSDQVTEGLKYRVFASPVDKKAQDYFCSWFDSEQDTRIKEYFEKLNSKLKPLVAV